MYGDVVVGDYKAADRIQAKPRSFCGLYPNRGYPFHRGAWP